MGGRGEPPLCDIGGGFLELLVRGLFQARGGMEANLRHIVGNLDPQERSHLQGHHPIRQCHHSHRRRVLSFLAPRRLMPLESCTPATIDFVVKFFITLMKIGGTVWGALLPLIKNKIKLLILRGVLY